jgi:hypothetical protein
MSGSYLRIHETDNLNLCIRYITHHTSNHLYHFDSEIRIRIVIHRVYIALFCCTISITLRVCRVTNPSEWVLWLNDMGGTFSARHYIWLLSCGPCGPTPICGVSKKPG